MHAKSTRIRRAAPAIVVATAEARQPAYSGPMMRAWAVSRPGPLARRPLTLQFRDVPEPGPGQVLLAISACGVCRTDLHIVTGDLPVHRRGVVPGHEVVGRVVRAGPGPTRFTAGDRIGVAWLAATCGTCAACRRGAENLCRASRYTGWDVDGGYAEFLVAEEAYAYPLPAGLDDQAAAPLLCAGIIGYRALTRACLPPGGRLGLYGFGGSAHLTAQLALAQGAEVHVFTRGENARRLALELGATSAGEAGDPSPVPLDAAILFAPAGELVPVALAALGDGGTLAVAGIHLSDIPALSYQRDLFRERTLTSVTSNTRRDGIEFLELAARYGVRAHTTPYRFEDAPEALAYLEAGDVRGAGVLLVG